MFCFLTEKPEERLKDTNVKLKPEKESVTSQTHKTNRSTEENTYHLLAAAVCSDAETGGSLRSESLLRSGLESQFSGGSAQEGAPPANLSLTSSHGRLSSSCSTVVMTEEQLMLNPINAEVKEQ